MRKLNSFLIIFEHCIPVKGSKYCVIQDNQRGKIVRIPSLLYEFMLQANRQPMEEIQAWPVYREHLNEFIEFLIKEEYAFFTDTPERFRTVESGFEYPEMINNIIIDYSPRYEHQFDQIVQDIGELGCKHLQLRFFDNFTYIFLYSALNKLLSTRLISIEVILKFQPGIHVEMINSIVEEFPLVRKFQVFNVEESYLKILRETGARFYNGTLFRKENIHNEKSCGVIGEHTFSINLYSFALSQNYNNCLYKKIAVDTQGNIKNCPSASTILGNVKEDSIASVVRENLKIRDLWSITKESVKGCNTCEYRYACSDCRVYLETPEDIYSKPLKCGYDPDKGSWEEWSTHPLKQKAIDYYGMRDVLPEFKKPTSDVRTPPSSESIE